MASNAKLMEQVVSFIIANANKSTNFTDNDKGKTCQWKYSHCSGPKHCGETTNVGSWRQMLTLGLLVGTCMTQSEWPALSTEIQEHIWQSENEIYNVLDNKFIHNLAFPNF